MGVDRDEFPIERSGEFVSNLQVLHSNAGYYIGRTCCDKEDGFEEPFSRESVYYPTREAAQRDLHTMSFPVRDCVENNFMYANGFPRPEALKKEYHERE